MRLRKYRDDDRGITSRVISMDVSGKRAAYSVAVSDYEQRSDIARKILYARKELREFVARESASL